MSFYFGRLWRYYSAITLCCGWAQYKYYGPYGKRYYHDHDKILLMAIPFVNLLFIPYVMGHICGTLHDRLLYKLNPTYYQKLINSYDESFRLYLSTVHSKDSNNAVGGTGNPQITYF